MPLTDSDRLQKIKERKAQLEKQEKAIINREKEKARKIETRRKIIIGGIVEKYLPLFGILEPKRTKEENEIEFAIVANFFEKLVREKNMVEWLLEDEPERARK